MNCHKTRFNSLDVIVCWYGSLNLLKPNGSGTIESTSGLCWQGDPVWGMTTFAPRGASDTKVVPLRRAEISLLESRPLALFWSRRRSNRLSPRAGVVQVLPRIRTVQ